MSIPTIARYQHGVLDPATYVTTLFRPPRRLAVVDLDANDCFDIVARLVPRCRATAGFIDFIRTFVDDVPYSGAIVHDGNGYPLIRFTTALLGYDGAGPELSRQILMELEVPSERFDILNSEARPRYNNYAIRQMLY